MAPNIFQQLKGAMQSGLDFGRRTRKTRQHSKPIQVFQGIEDHGFKLNEVKCLVFKSNVRQIIDGNGHIKNIPDPTKVTNSKSFLGLSQSLCQTCIN